MTYETLLFYILLAVTWYIKTTTAYLRPFLADNQYTYVEKFTNSVLRSISGFLGQNEMEIKTPSTATTKLRVSTSDDMAMKQSESSRKLSEMASFNVMGYLRNSGWVRNDSAELHQKYVDNMHAAELGDPNMVLNPESRANYNANRQRTYDNDDSNLVRTIRSTLGGAVESFVTMLPLSDQNSENFYNYADKIENIYKSEEMRHRKAHNNGKMETDVTSSSSNNNSQDEDASDCSYEIVAIEDIGTLRDDMIESKVLDRDDDEEGSKTYERTTPVIIPGYMEFDPKSAAASTMKKKNKLPSALSLNSFSSRGGLIAGAFFASKRQ